MASKPITQLRLSAHHDSAEAAWAVNGLALVGTEYDSLVLFAVTESQTLAFDVRSTHKTLLDQQGVRAPGCTALRPQAAAAGLGSTLLVAREEGLYEYTPDTRAGCTVFEGSKQSLALLHRMVVLVTQETNDVTGLSSATVHVADLRFKLIAGSLTVPSVAAVIPFGAASFPRDAAGGNGSGMQGAGMAGGDSAASSAPAPPQQLAVVTGAGNLHILREVELQAQLDVLFKRSLHKLALDLATAMHAPIATVANIHQRWGDALYVKGEYDASMAQYCETLSFLEPSYVVRRFLDAQRIHNLTSYLELLHDRGLANADHTTLLLNCYTKLKDVTKLDAFVQSSTTAVISRSGSGTSTSAALAPAKAKAGGASPTPGRSTPQQPALRFDAEIAVKVLRSAGYARHALRVAEAASQPDWVLDILLEDCADWDQALAFLEQLPREQCAAMLRRVGKPLVAARPEASTRMLMELCIPGPEAGSAAFTAGVADFAHLFTDAPTSLMLLCEFILNTAPPGAIANEDMLYHTLLELYLADHLPDTTPPPAGSAPGSTPTPPSTSEDPTSAALPGGPGGAAAVEAAADKQARRLRALELLNVGWPPHLDKPKYDPDHALVLCRLACFKEGLVLLYDRLRLHREVLQVYMDAADHAGLMAAVTRYGDSSRGGDPQLWAEVLQHFVSQPGNSCEEQVVAVVAAIEASRILPPLVVLQLLAQNRLLKVSAVRGYISRALAREAADAQRDRAAVTRLAADTAACKAEVARLTSQARVFQALRCAATGQPLELPALHFLCGHSFNARSLGDNDKECPLCAPDFKRVIDIRRNMAVGALQQDRFFTELRESSDGFSVVAEHFGRGLMNMTAASLHAAGTAAGISSNVAGAVVAPSLAGAAVLAGVVPS